MAWQEQLLERLVQVTPGGYLPGAPAASEPAAWAVIACAQLGQLPSARRAADWLVKIQQRDGSVGVNAQQATPAWPTSLAILAWLAIQQTDGSHRYDSNIRTAADWALDAKGRTTQRESQIGHDTTLVGWSWAAQTHSWLEPTAMFVTALRAAGHGDHPRVREGVTLLIDRLLPSGGCNYGNTIVLGQELLPHVQPTGLVLWALASEGVPDERIEKAITYLEKNLGREASTASLAYGLIGLTAQGRRPSAADEWLQAAAARELAKQPSPYKLALLAAALNTAPAPQLAAAAS
jgi:hypothetical protein